MLHAFDKAEWKWLFSKRNLVMYLVRLNLKTNEIVQKKKKNWRIWKKLIYEIEVG